MKCAAKNGANKLSPITRCSDSSAFYRVFSFIEGTWYFYHLILARRAEAPSAPMYEVRITNYDLKNSRACARKMRCECRTVADYCLLSLPFSALCNCIQQLFQTGHEICVLDALRVGKLSPIIPPIFLLNFAG